MLLEFKIFTNYYDYLIKENKMGGACGINGKDGKCMHNFSGKI
jgi:hypothetical protein